MVDGGAASPQRLAGLDGLRAVSCLAVLVAHVAGATAPDIALHLRLGWLAYGAIVFFALSGFLLYLPIVGNLNLETPRDLDLATYTRRRLLRIFPAYLVIFALAGFALGAVYLTNPAEVTPPPTTGTGRMTDSWLLAGNLTLLHSYVPSMFQTGINPSWSLTVEITFYLVLPLMAMAAIALRRRTRTSVVRVSFIAPIVLLTTGLTTKLLLDRHFSEIAPSTFTSAHWGANWAAVAEHSLLAQADTFAMGMVAAVVFVAVRNQVPRFLSVGCGALVMVSAGTLLVVGAQSVFCATAVAVGAAAAILGITAGGWRRCRAVLSAPPLEFLGRISLSIYLWHYPILLFAIKTGWVGGTDVTGLVRSICVVFAMSTAASVVTYHAVERPAMRFALRKQISADGTPEHRTRSLDRR